MHGSLAKNQLLIEQILSGISDLHQVDAALCVPFPFLMQAQSALSGSAVGWGGQNVSEHDQGAYTGEVDATMLANFACQYVIVGHSERRALFGESDSCIAEKVEKTLMAGMVPILCVGETLVQRNAGRAFDVLSAQLSVAINRVGVARFVRVVVAYEPVWAIGTGVAATPELVREVHAFIRAYLVQVVGDAAAGIKILYGGSVKPQNAQELFSVPEVGGGLIGGASLVAEDFLAICRAAGLAAVS